MSRSSTYREIIWFRFIFREHSAFHRSSSFFRLRGGHHRNRPLPSLGIPLCRFNFSIGFLVRCHPDCFMTFSRSSSSKIPSFRGTFRIYSEAGGSNLFRRPHPQKYLLSGMHTKIYRVNFEEGKTIPSSFRGRETQFAVGLGPCCVYWASDQRPARIIFDIIFHKTLR